MSLTILPGRPWAAPKKSTKSLTLPISARLLPIRRPALSFAIDLIERKDSWPPPAGQSAINLVIDIHPVRQGGIDLLGRIIQPAQGLPIRPQRRFTRRHIG